MMTKEKLFFGLLIVLIILGVGGCASNTKAKYSDAILSHLREKYGEEFEIIQITREFSGNEGIFVRAVCQSNTYPEKCVVYAYRDYETEGAKVKIGRKTHTVVDDYADIIFSYEYTRQLQEQLGEDIFIKSWVNFTNHMITDEEYEMGLEKCIQNPELHSNVDVCVIADKKYLTEGLQERIEQLMLSYDGYGQYLFLGYSDEMDINKCEQLYLEKGDYFISYVCDEENDFVEWVDLSHIYRDEGVVKRLEKKR